MSTIIYNTNTLKEQWTLASNLSTEEICSKRSTQETALPEHALCGFCASSCSFHPLVVRMCVWTGEGVKADWCLIHACVALKVILLNNKQKVKSFIQKENRWIALYAWQAQNTVKRLVWTWLQPTNFIFLGCELLNKLLARSLLHLRESPCKPMIL